MFLSRSDKSKYEKILSDLPRGGKYATRDVHRKTQGCFAGKLEIDKDIFKNINNVTKRNLELRADSDVGAIPEFLLGPDFFYYSFKFKV